MPARRSRPRDEGRTPPRGPRPRDVEQRLTRSEFARTLRRIADSVESSEAVRIEVAGEKLTIPMSAAMSIEHERGGGSHELELQLRWSTRGSAEEE